MKKYLMYTVLFSLLFFTKNNFAQQYNIGQNYEGKIIVAEKYIWTFHGNIGDTIYYTLDGSDPVVNKYSTKGLNNHNIILQEQPARQDREIILKTLVVDKNGNKNPIKEYKYKFASMSVVDDFFEKIEKNYLAEEAMIEKTAKEILRTAKTDFDKIKKAYDWMLRTFVYLPEYTEEGWRKSKNDYNNDTYYLPSSYDFCKERNCRLPRVYDDGKSIDERGCAEILSKLLDRIGIENDFVYWQYYMTATYFNIVTLNGKRYNLFLPVDYQSGSKYYRGFLVSDKVMGIHSDNQDILRNMNTDEVVFKTRNESYDTRGMTKPMIE